MTASSATVLALLIIACACHAQRKMLVLKAGNKVAYYHIGDKIGIKLKGGGEKIKGQIEDLKDSLITFRHVDVSLSEIERVYIDDKTKWWLRFKLEQLCLLAGSAYLVANVINTGELHQETLIISGALIGVGLLGKWLIGNSIKIKGRRRLKILSV